MRQKNNGEIDSIPIEIINRKIALTDSLNYLIISKLFIKYGFLGYDEVGELGSHNFWLLVQHQDKQIDFQERVLEEMKKIYR